MNATSTLSLKNKAQAQQPQLAIASEQLLRGQNEVLIHHAGQEYRLRLTKQNKLILNK
jgi:hemin uptake protein HemP